LRLSATLPSSFSFLHKDHNNIVLIFDININITSSKHIALAEAAALACLVAVKAPGSCYIIMNPSPILVPLHPAAGAGNIALNPDTAAVSDATVWPTRTMYVQTSPPADRERAQPQTSEADKKGRSCLHVKRRQQRQVSISSEQGIRIYAVWP
jgi:hypothetical protein